MRWEMATSTTSKKSSKTSKEKMLSRDCRRRVDLIKKIKELEVPTAFCYIAPWSSEVFMAGDSRITDSFRSKVEDILKKLNSNDDKLEPDHHVGLCLPKLPGRLETLNGRSLQTIIVAIAKDLKISWDGEKPDFWPEKIPFSNPRTVPESFKSM